MPPRPPKQPPPKPLSSPLPPADQATRVAMPPVRRLREVGADFTRDPEVVRQMVAVIRALMRRK